MMEFLIYGLRDPRTQEIRYVGKSARGLLRPAEHFPPPKADKTHKANWLRKLQTIGLSPEIVILEVCGTRENLPARECYWIAIGRAALKGRLTNGTEGGDGCTTPTPEIRAKMSAGVRAAKNRPEAKARISECSKEVARRPEVRAKKSIGMREVWKRPGYAETHNAALRAALNRPEVKNKRSAAAKAAHARPDVKERHRAGLLAAAARPGVSERRSVSARKALLKPETNTKLRAAIKAGLSRPEVKAKIAAASRAAWAKHRAQTRPRIRINLIAKNDLAASARGLAIH